MMRRLALELARAAWVRLTARRCNAALVEVDSYGGVRYPANVVGVVVAACERWHGHRGEHVGAHKSGERVTW